MPEPSAASKPRLQVRDLRVTFRGPRGPRRAVDGVSFDLAAGEVLGVVGESGSGKSVSMLALLGLLDGRNARVQGSATLEGRELIALPERQLRQSPIE